MDSERSAKRRKLDIGQQRPQNISSVSRKKGTPVTYSKKHTTGPRHNETLSEPPSVANEAKDRSSAHDAWFEAKAKSQALRGKRIGTTVRKEKNADVYDDIDGAHAHQSPLKKKSTAPSTPAKKQLDPLRNQKSAVIATPSPSKGAALGFFKQFHQPKSATANTAPQTTEKAEKVVNGATNHDQAQNQDDVVQDAEQDSPDESRSSESSSDDDSSDEDSVNEKEKATDNNGQTQDTPVAHDGKSNGRGWTYEQKPKKTFEDQITELEDAAREEAAKEDGDAGLQTVTSTPRRTNRVSKSDSKNLLKVESKKRPTPKATTQKVQTIGLSKASRRSAIDSTQSGNQEVEDRMHVEYPDDGNTPLTKKALSKTYELQDGSSAKPKPQQRSRTAEPSNRPTSLPEHLQQIQTVLLEKLTGKRPIRLTNLDIEHAKVSNLITQTVTAGESNSMLVIGARGSGKSALVNQILREQTEQHADDFHVVKLNGFIHTDDKIALREIWRQLGREMELDEEEGNSKNYADTLTTLLALLSHPAEHGREQPDQVTKSVVFILDEFELFASHPRQTLLYNLFDIAQSRKAPIAVLGLTTRIDVAESLEKRVKSRFSHRYVHLSLAKSFVTFQEACKASVCIHSDELSSDERKQLGASSEVTQKLEKASKKQSHSTIADWNSLMEELLAHEAFTNHLRRLYYTTKSVPEFHASMLMAVSTMPVDSVRSTDDLVDHFKTEIVSSSAQQPDSKLSLLSSLSTLQLALLICAARLTAIHNLDTVPFAQAYEEYKVLASKAKLQASAAGALAQGAGSRVWSKDVAKGAWEDLIECELVMEDGSRGGRIDVGLEEIGMSGVDLGSWGRWCKEI